MFSAAAAPMWVAIIALVGTVATPIITSLFNRSGQKADAAEKFTRIAAGVAEDLEEMKAEFGEFKRVVRVLLRVLERLIRDAPMNADRIETERLMDELRSKL